VTNHVMSHNPAELLPEVPGGHPRPRPCPDDVWHELLATAAPREQMMARLACEAGLRRAEVARCRREHLIQDRGGWSLIVVGKGGRQRVVPVTDDLAAAITTFCPGGWLFPNGTGGHLGVKHVGVLLSRLMPQGWTAHTLRHRFASRGYAGTGNLRAVQEALGHASIATTQRYTAVSRDDVRAVSEAAGYSGDAA
jgi:integrase